MRIARAAATGSVAMPSERATSLDVPNGRIASTAPVPASSSAAAPTVPSPPAATTSGRCPGGIATTSASASRSAMSSSRTTSMPDSTRACFAKSYSSAEPEDGLASTHAAVGTGVPSGRGSGMPGSLRSNTPASAAAPTPSAAPTTTSVG